MTKKLIQLECTLIPFLTTSNSISKSFSNLIIVIELTSKTNKSQDVESQLLHDKQENEAVGKPNCSTSSGNAISHNTTTSNEPNKSLRMKRNEEKNSLPSNGRENGEFTQENLMRQKIEFQYIIALVSQFPELTYIVVVISVLNQCNTTFIFELGIKLCFVVKDL